MEHRKNSYEGVCRLCGTKVRAEAGHIKKDVTSDKWLTYHNDGECPTAAIATKPATDNASMDVAVEKVIGLMTSRFMELIPDLVSENLAKLSRVAEIKVGKAPSIKIEGVAHNMLPTLVTALVAETHPYIVGPAGSGKTTLAMQCADALKLPFYMESRVTSEFKLLGFIDAAGNVVQTQFRKAYEDGGVFLLDEVDASDPDAMTAFNAALANGVCAFPDKLVKRHKNFRPMAAGNTFGRGADRQYVGRNQLDAATLDRFETYEVNYDEQLELDISGNVEWARYCQAVRKACEAAKVRHIVSPRASINGAKLLAHGMEWAVVEEAVVWKGLDEANRTRVTALLKETPRAAA